MMVLSIYVSLLATLLIFASVVISSGSESDNHCDPLFLTPYIKAGKVDEAKNLSEVHLPEYTGFEKSYSGYLTVNESCNSNLFFWFFPAKFNYKTAPVILWLQGGPGDTSMYGLFQEIGPFYLYNNSELRPRKYSWSLNNSVLFIDNPVGAGYSFTDKDECYARNQDDIRINLYNALIQFFTLFPELGKNEFFICGESYGGKYATGLGYSIHENNKKSSIKINLKGLGIVSGAIDPINSMVVSSHLYQLGLIDEYDRKILRDLEREVVSLTKEENWEKAYSKTGEVFWYTQKTIRSISLYNYSKTKSPLDYPSYSQFKSYVTKNKIKCAIHVGSNTNFKRNTTYEPLQEDRVKSVKPWVEILIENYKIVFFNGEFDIIVGFPMTRKVTNKLQWSGRKSYLKAKRTHYSLENGTICGFIKRYKNLHVALVRNAGHTVPQDQPECTYRLITEYLLKGPKNKNKRVN